MKNSIIIIFYLLSTIAYSQSDSDYDIFIMANSNKKEVLTVENKVNDSFFIKSFSMSNNKYESTPKYSLKIDKKGTIIKNIVGSSNGSCCKINFIYIFNKNKIIKLPKKNNKNIIDYETFQNIKFSNFLNILNNASKVYFVDISEISNNSKCYVAYEVSF